MELIDSPNEPAGEKNIHTSEKESNSEDRDESSTERKIAIKKKKWRPMTTTCSYCLSEIYIYIFNDHFESHPAMIFEWLYFGNYNHANNIDELKYAKIKYILVCAKECKNLFENKFNYKEIPMCYNDGIKLLDYIEEAIEFIEEGRLKKCNVFVHCRAGMSRSPSVIIAYLMKMKNFAMDAAIEYVKKRREIQLTRVAIQQLREYEKTLKEKRVSITTSAEIK